MPAFWSKTINMMFLPIILTIFYSTFLINGFINFIPSAEASIEGSACSQDGIIEKHDEKLLCMCNGIEVQQDQYCKKGIIHSIEYDLMEITITKGNDSPKKPVQRKPNPLPVKSIANTYPQAKPAPTSRGIQSIEKEPSSVKLPSSVHQCISK